VRRQPGRKIAPRSPAVVVHNRLFAMASTRLSLLPTGDAQAFAAAAIELAMPGISCVEIHRTDDPHMTTSSSSQATANACASPGRGKSDSRVGRHSRIPVWTDHGGERGAIFARLARTVAEGDDGCVVVTASVSNTPARSRIT